MSSTQRWAPSSRTALIACSAVVAVLTSVYLYKDCNTDHEPDSDTKRVRSSGLHRVGAIRRRRRPYPEEEEVVRVQAPPGSTVYPVGADGTIFEVRPIETEPDAEENDDGTEQSIPDEDAEQVASNQADYSKLKELTLFIAQHREIEEGVVHRGIQCDSCQQRPIRGVRYRCANCEDFDLCETCEAMNTHISTHVFYKIRVPCFWGPGRPQAVWYPGQPKHLPEELSASLIDDVRTYLMFIDDYMIPSEAELKGLWRQYVNLADELYPDDDVLREVDCGISRSAFRYLIPVTRRGALPVNRLFKLFNRRDDGLISFREFVHGAVMVNWRRRFPGWRDQVFKAIDLDDDGYVSRDDMLQLYTSLHEITEDITLCHLRLFNESEDQRHVDGYRTLRDYVDSTRPLPNYFYGQTFDQLHLHRQDEPIFGQNFAESLIPNDDSGGGLLMEEGGEALATSQLPSTAASAFVHEKLKEAFNELLDPIFAEVELNRDSHVFTAALRQRHADLFLALREKRTHAAFEAAKQDVDYEHQTRGEPVPQTFPEREASLTLDMWCRVTCQMQAVLQPVLIETLLDVYPDHWQRVQLADDLLAFCERWPRQVGLDLLDSQDASTWFPAYRHETLPMRPDLLYYALSWFINKEVWAEHHAHGSRAHEGKLNDREFWKVVDRERLGDEPVSARDPLPMLDVLGLVVV